MNPLMIVLAVVGTVALLLAAEVGKDMFVTEADTRLERLPLAILHLARRRLAAHHRAAIYEDEWLPDLEFIARETGGLPITRLVRTTRFAIGLLWSAPSISAARSGWANKNVGAALSEPQAAAGVVPAGFTRFQRDAVLMIRTALAHQPDAWVLGVEGPWGSGKTSVLAETQHVGTDGGATDIRFISVSFNPWHFESERMPNVSLVDVIESVVAKASHEAGLTRQRGRPWRRGRTDTARLRRPGRTHLRVLNRLMTRQATADRRPTVVVFIDDLDRCRPHTVVAVLNAVRVLSSRFPDNPIRFVLAYDPDWVAATLDQMLATTVDPSRGSSTAASGRAFLEKLIQIQAQLPDRLRPFPPNAGSGDAP